jgi:hypothetical protein
MHNNATKCNETLSKCCKNKHGASKIIDTLEMYQGGVMSYKFSLDNFCFISCGKSIVYPIIMISSQLDIINIIL